MCSSEVGVLTRVFGGEASEVDLLLTLPSIMVQLKVGCVSNSSCNLNTATWRIIPFI